jgi:hypothetical protein
MNSRNITDKVVTLNLQPKKIEDIKKPFGKNKKSEK